MSNHLVLKKGLDIPIKGKAAPSVLKCVVPDIVAVKPTDFKGLVPRLLVREGDAVKAGSPVLADKMHPEILLTSPVSGKVQAIVRGAKRKLLAVLIKADAKQARRTSRARRSASCRNISKTINVTWKRKDEHEG